LFKLTALHAIFSHNGRIFVTQTIEILKKSDNSSNFIFKQLKPFAMKSTILLLALSAAALSSCTTAYKTGQTPDDVYYSPVRPQDEYVRIEKQDDRRYSSNNDYYYDRYLRMKLHNRTQWSYLDDWYDYERYGTMGNYYYGTYNNPYNSWNYYYNPYCQHRNVIILNSKYTAINNNLIKPRNFSLNTYTNNNYNNSNNNRVNLKTEIRPAYNNSNGLSNTLKQIFTGGNSNNSSNTPARIYNPSTNSSSSGSSRSSSGSSSGSTNGGASRPIRN
jgi:hypothetical protein